VAVNGTLLIVGGDRVDAGVSHRAAHGLAVRSRLVFRDIDRLAGYACLQLRAGVRPMIETYPLERVAEAYDRMMSGKARFRVVLTIGS
jgi:D-arabinose 1-dehydrogenase-like Zn-dependent alcohol dehydrogenase